MAADTPDNYYTVPFELGQAVVHTCAEGLLTSIEFDLSGKYEHRPGSSKLARDLRSCLQGEEVKWDVRLDLGCLTSFQRKVYERVTLIPRGQVSTYGNIAADVGSPGGARAVGQTMAGNRFPLIVPCHRVIAARRKIGGFSSGIDLKRYLLRLEGADL